MQTKRSFSWVLLVAACGCSQRPPEAQAVNAAAEAMGGVEAVRAVTSLTLEGSGSAYRLGQNMSPDSELPISAVQSYTWQVDLPSHRARTETASANFLGNLVTQVAALDGRVAFNVGGNGAAQRMGGMAAADRTAEYYHHPLTLLQAALAEDEAMMATVSNLRQETGHEVVDIRTPDGVELALHLDAGTHLPLMITSRSYNSNLGDVVVTSEFSDYTDVGGLQLPATISRRIDEFPALEVTVTNAVNETVGDLAAPADVASAPEPGAAPVTVAVEELADGVWFLGGGSHHSVLVEFDAYTALVEAPLNDARTLAVINRAREIVPGKPLQYLVNTHHHFDHSGGLRAAVAEGLTVITHEVNRPLYEALVARPHTIMADHLAQNPAPLTIETVTGDEKYELTDGRRTMEMYRIAGDTHNAGILMVYLPAERILIEGDVYTPGRGGPTAENLLKNIQDRGLRVRTIAPIHGQVVPFAELEKTVASDSD
jgi:glyoxylase-like metal-dependent hydrolase (beta-lactamase superfamily II)